MKKVDGLPRTDDELFPARVIKMQSNCFLEIINKGAEEEFNDPLNLN